MALQCSPAPAARHIQANLNLGVFKKTYRPCVVSAVLRTLWNGRRASGRMRSLNRQASGLCVFGCKHAEDRVEHYLLCDVAWNLFSRLVPQGLGLRQSLRNLQAMMLADNAMDAGEIVGVAVGIYAASRAVQQLKSCHAALQPTPLLRLYAVEGMRGAKRRSSSGLPSRS